MELEVLEWSKIILTALAGAIGTGGALRLLWNTIRIKLIDTSKKTFEESTEELNKTEKILSSTISAMNIATECLNNANEKIEEISLINKKIDLMLQNQMLIATNDERLVSNGVAKRIVLNCKEAGVYNENKDKN